MNNHVIKCELDRLTQMMEQAKSEMEFNFWKNHLTAWFLQLADENDKVNFNN